jgi:hypothetical protein
MPLDALQSAVFATLRARRHPDSHVAGAAALHRHESSPRYSEDIDIFHDAAAMVAENSEQDAGLLAQSGYSVVWQNRTEGFHRAWVERGGQGIKIEWVFDSAFRFFPVQPDPVLGFRLHDADLAVNKVLAGAGRLVIRDYIDLIHLHRTYLQLGALAWAGTGKDPGMSPLLILNELNRHTRYQPEELAEVRLREPLSLPGLKVEWLEMLRSARELVERLPSGDVGCLYLDRSGCAVTPRPEDPAFDQLTRHWGSVKGSWPRVVND